MNYIAGALKAFVAALIALLGSLATGLVDDKSLADLTDGQWVTAILAAVIALAAVYGVPNKTS